MIRLPVAAGGTAPASPLAAAPAADVCTLAGLRVLVVDDDPETLEILRLTLTSLGAEVRGAGSAAEAFGEFERDAPDVLISDIGMPGEDGYGLIARIRALPPERGGRVPARVRRRIEETDELLLDLSLLLDRAVAQGIPESSLEVIEATVLKRELLREYVTRLVPNDAEEWERTYQRLKRQRSRAMERLRALLVSPVAEAAGF